MNRVYHEWTAEEIEKIHQYIREVEHPLSLYRLMHFAKSMGVSVSSARGAVYREIAKTRVDVRDR